MVDEPEEESFPPEESPSAPGIRQETSPPEAEPAGEKNMLSGLEQKAGNFI